jgi:hypothetical protein
MRLQHFGRNGDQRHVPFAVINKPPVCIALSLRIADNSVMTAKHTPTTETRAIVERAASIGFREVDIAAVIGVSDRTLRTYYKEELRTGHLKANLAVGGRLFERCMEGDKACLIFWAKTRMGWRETDRHELTGPGGAPLPGAAPRAPVLVVPGMLNPAEWDKLAAQHRTHQQLVSERMRAAPSLPVDNTPGIRQNVSPVRVGPRSNPADARSPELPMKVWAQAPYLRAVFRSWRKPRLDQKFHQQG